MTTFGATTETAPAPNLAPGARIAVETAVGRAFALAGDPVLRYCLGAPLALLESEVVLAVLAARAPGLARAGAGTRWNSALLGGFRTLPLRV